MQGESTNKTYCPIVGCPCYINRGDRQITLTGLNDEENKRKVIDDKIRRNHNVERLDYMYDDREFVVTGSRNSQNAMNIIDDMLEMLEKEERRMYQKENLHNFKNTVIDEVD